MNDTAGVGVSYTNSLSSPRVATRYVMQLLLDYVPVTLQSKARNVAFKVIATQFIPRRQTVNET